MSAKPILYYMPASQAARTVLLVARAINLELDLKIVNLMNGEHLEPWFLELNPQHTVPTLVDDGHSLWESHVIATYLIGKYGGSDDHPLYPRDLYQRARIDHRLHFNSAVVFRAARGIFFNIIFNGATGWTAEEEAAVHDAYALLERFLATDDYVGGSRMTVADFGLITTITQLATTLPLDVSKYPKIVAWIGRMEQLPYYHEINTVNLEMVSEIVKGALQRNREAKKGGMSCAN